MGDDVIGIKIVSYTSTANVVRIIRKYSKSSMAEIKNAVNTGEFVYAVDQYDEGALDDIIRCRKELVDAGIEVQLYMGDEQVSLQFIRNLRESSREIGYEVEAEAELENADMEALREFRYLWTDELDKWVVVKTELGFLIVDKDDRHVMLIEDEELNNQVAAMMIMNGCEVVRGIDGL